MNKNFYFPLVCLIVFLILFSLIRIYRCVYIKNEKFSLVTFLPLILYFWGTNYIYNAINIDDFHNGETLATFYIHDKFHAKFYKDIMLVHGFVDIVPPWLGKYIFNNNNIYGFLLGNSLWANISLLLNSSLALFVFRKKPILASGILLMLPLFSTSSFFYTFALAYLFLLEKMTDTKSIVWLYVYTISAFIIANYSTTIGTAWFIASLPLAFYMFYCLLKSEMNIKTKLLQVFSLLFLNVLILYCLKDFYAEYFQKAQFYIHANLFSFGNNFSESIHFREIFSSFIKLFAFLTVPCFIVELVNSDKKNKQYVFMLIFAVLWCSLLINYSFGRIDYIKLGRFRQISFAYITVLIPYLIFISRPKFTKYLEILLIASIFITSVPIFIHFNIKHDKSSGFGLNLNYINRLINLKTFVDKNSENLYDYLDLTNRGMHYMYMIKKPPIPYFSFYTIVSTKQAKDALNKIIKNEPNVILISSSNLLYDDIYPSLRINPIYRWILLSGKYSILEDNGNVFLLKKNIHKYNYSELKHLDNIFSKGNLERLPEAWGNSIKNLPIRKTDVEKNILVFKNTGIIKFKNALDGRETDLLYINPETDSACKDKTINYQMSINNSDSTLTFRGKGKEFLVPFDNYPSWLLNDNVNEIKVSIDKNCQIKNMQFHIYEKIKTDKNTPK
ncbi:MAG: hypothetical protein PHC64_06200 [Candidatus Gastranaerophilales bacterium]|nr:hypothetical protein [Candidatus Gastranaerophilales bacterium]